MSDWDPDPVRYQCNGCGRITGLGHKTCRDCVRLAIKADRQLHSKREAEAREWMARVKRRTPG